MIRCISHEYRAHFSAEHSFSEAARAEANASGAIGSAAIGCDAWKIDFDGPIKDLSKSILRCDRQATKAVSAGYEIVHAQEVL